MKGKGDPTAMNLTSLAHQGSLCAWALARAHARTGDPLAIAGYVGRGAAFDRAIVEFAARYGDQVERDIGRWSMRWTRVGSRLGRASDRVTVGRSLRRPWNGWDPGRHVGSTGVRRSTLPAVSRRQW